MFLLYLSVYLAGLIRKMNLVFCRVMVKMTDLFNGNSWLWDRGKFMNRRYLMQVSS